MTADFKLQSEKKHDFHWNGDLALFKVYRELTAHVILFIDCTSWIIGNLITSFTVTFDVD